MIADCTSRPVDAVLTTVSIALRAGVRCVQYRDKSAANDSERRERASKLLELCARHDALFIVNDRIDLALSIGAHGAHLGPSDMPVAQARQLAPAAFLLGASAGTVEAARRHEASGADYLGVGAVFDATPSKPDATSNRGPEILRAIAAEVSLPLVAIGGINPQNAAICAAHGATGVAVIRAVLDAADPAKAVAQILACFPRKAE
ncbi:MAG: thiamine phosphate synthase [Myxococcales bacterium]|nr:thiamine phosphate synthase [Myxococcales bacterium]